MADELKSISSQTAAAQAALALQQTTLSQHEAAFLSLQATLLEGKGDGADNNKDDGNDDDNNKKKATVRMASSGPGRPVEATPLHADEEDGSSSSGVDDDGTGAVKITAAELLSAQQDLRDLKEGLVVLEQVGDPLPCLIDNNNAGTQAIGYFHPLTPCIHAYISTYLSSPCQPTHELHSPNPAIPPPLYPQRFSQDVAGVEEDTRWLKERLARLEHNNNNNQASNRGGPGGGGASGRGGGGGDTLGEERASGDALVSGGSSTVSLGTGLGPRDSNRSSGNVYDQSSTEGVHVSSSSSSFDIEMDEAVRLLSKDVHTVRTMLCHTLLIPTNTHIL